MTVRSYTHHLQTGILFLHFFLRLKILTNAQKLTKKQQLHKSLWSKRGTTCPREALKRRRRRRRRRRKKSPQDKVLLRKSSKLLFLWAQVALLLAHVPVQTLSQTFEPVVHWVPETDGWDGVARGGDGDARERRGEMSISNCRTCNQTFRSKLGKL